MSVRILAGDCRDVLPTLEAGSVHCIVTSPPYFGLRDYQTGEWEGGDAGCDHLESKPSRTAASTASSGLEGGKGNTHRSHAFGGECGRCGARRIDRQIGLEQTPDAYVAELVAVFRECRRVLRDDGVCWVNLGDSYASGGAAGRPSDKSTLSRHGTDGRSPYLDQFGEGISRRPAPGLKPKDLIGIPWLVAFALRADGWYLRSDCIWSKPNPMPESVRDRPTKAHEYIFLLSKRERYYFDQEAVREAGCLADDRPRRHGSGETVQAKGVGGYRVGGTESRNIRSVWTVATQPYSEAHFATFPPALIEPCIKAGCPEKACAKCGAPWMREVEKSGGINKERGLSPKHTLRDELGVVHKGQGKSGLSRPGWRGDPPLQSTTLGFSPSCSCNAATVPGTVLDPFAGAGTTGMVADRLQRNAILIELSPSYADMAEARIRSDGGMFVDTARREMVTAA